MRIPCSSVVLRSVESGALPQLGKKSASFVALVTGHKLHTFNSLAGISVAVDLPDPVAPGEEGTLAKEDRGFASMDRAKQREIASKGGKAAHQKGTAHEWTSEEARDAGRKGGIASHQRRREQGGGTPAEGDEVAMERGTDAGGELISSVESSTRDDRGE
jgi:general stress protein YciG